jgi:uncharacterized OB-fold protein
MNSKLPDLPPVAQGVFTLPPYDQFPPRLIGSMCPSCNEYFFPATPYCRKCLEPTARADLGSQGVLYSYTVIRTKAPLGLPTPYCVGYVDLAERSLRIFFLLDPDAIETFKPGLAVRLAVKPLGVDQQGSPCLRPYFTPKG